MDYLTNYYKNLSEQLQVKINILESAIYKKSLMLNEDIPFDLNSAFNRYPKNRRFEYGGDMQRSGGTRARVDQEPSDRFEYGGDMQRSGGTRARVDQEPNEPSRFDDVGNNGFGGGGQIPPQPPAPQPPAPQPPPQQPPPQQPAPQQPAPQQPDKPDPRGYPKGSQDPEYQKEWYNYFKWWQKQDPKWKKDNPIPPQPRDSGVPPTPRKGGGTIPGRGSAPIR